MKTGTITALEVQQRNKERVNVYIDGEFAFGLNIMDAAALHKGQELSEKDITRLQYGDDVVKAVDRAVNFLKYRPRSRQEVRQNLIQKAITPDAIEAALARLDALGYLDDTAFARFWVENRNTFKPRSPMALRMELRQKGVADTIINEVVAAVDAEDAAYRAAQQNLHRYRNHTPQDFQRKLGGMLQRRGFGYETVREVLQRVTEELHQDAPDYFHRAEPD